MTLPTVVAVVPVYNHEMAVPAVVAALRAHLRAPVGLEIGAQTPQEIAVSILAQVVADRNS